MNCARSEVVLIRFRQTSVLLGTAIGIGLIAATLSFLHAPLAVTGCVFALGAVPVALLALNARQTQLKSEVVHRLETILGATDLIVVTTNANGIVDGFSRAAEQALGYGPDEVVGKLTAAAFHPRSKGDHPYRENLDRARCEWLYLRKDGSTFPALITIGAIRSDSGVITGYFGVGIDISAQKANEAALREKQELIESIASVSPTIFFIYDLVQRQVLYANRLVPIALGYSDTATAAMGPDPLPSVIFPEDLDILFNRVQGILMLPDDEILETEIRCITAAGEMKWFLFRDVIFKRAENGKPLQVLVNVVDVTDRKNLDERVECQLLEIQDTNLALELQTDALEEANSQLQALAFTDGLTGIANHRSFQEQLAKCFDVAKRRKRELSLMLIDVDRFKEYNDTYGHPAGDVVLKRVAQVIGDNCPDGCTPARYGGEEFAVICPGLSAADAEALAERVRSNIEATPWPERSVTISIGVVHLTPSTHHASQLVTAADIALYTSKTHGRNRTTVFEAAAQRRLAS